MTESIFIAISGGSASGKTTVAYKLAELLGDGSAVLEMDSYYKDHSHLPQEEREKLNFDHPQAMDISLFKEHLGRLKAGHIIEKPVYDFHTHKLEAKTEAFAPKPYIIVEGLFALLDELKAAFHYRIFIDAPDEVRIARRLARDVNERGRQKEAVLKQYERSVRPMHEEFVAPSSRNADVVISWEKEDVGVLEKIVGNIKEI